MQASVQAFFDPATFTVSYVLKDPGSSACAIIDSVLDFNHAAGRTSTQSADRIIGYIRNNRLDTQWILETHVHADHLSAAPYLQAELGGETAIGVKVTLVQETFSKIYHTGGEFRTDGSQFGRLFEDGEMFRIGGLEVLAMHTPGHTPACMTYLAGDAAFIGDTLFMPDYGSARTDFPGGDARTLYRSIQKLYGLPSETRLFLCHDYLAPGRTEYAWECSVARQRAENIHVNDRVSEEEFVKMRSSRDSTLNMPALMIPAVQVNMRAGQMPPPEANGVSFLKLPINLF